jgi:hypothetical protein
VRYPSELFFLRDLVHRLRDQVHGRDSVWQIAPVFASIPFSIDCIDSLEAFKHVLKRRMPRLFSFGEGRARKAYVNMFDSATKPSYIRRMAAAFPGTRINQLSVLANEFVQSPESGGLAFAVFHPRDIRDKPRPGYVPCLIAGTFLAHHGELHVNAFFRSQSIIEFGVFDLLFLRHLQARFIESVSERPRAAYPKRRPVKPLVPGPLNLLFGRVIVQYRLARKPRGWIDRSEGVQGWLTQLQSTIDMLGQRAEFADEDSEV